MTFMRTLMCVTGIALGLLTGCASNPGLAKFGEAATTLAESYKPILNAPSRLCASRVLLRELVDSPSFDARSLSGDSALVADCKSLADQQAKRAVVADAISAYGQQLTGLTGAYPTALTTDIDGVAAAAKAIKDKGGDGFFDASRVDALTKFVSVVIEMTRAQAARRTAKEVMSVSQGPLENLVGEMKQWTQDTVVPRLNVSIEVRQRVLSGLVKLSVAPDGASALERAPFRLHQITVLKEIESLRSEIKTAQALIPAADALVQSHSALIKSFDSPSGTAQLEAIHQFIQQLRALRAASHAM